MLKPLLFLCWAAIFVSAGDQKNGTIESSVKSQLPLADTKLPASTSNMDAHVPSAQTELPLSSLKPSDSDPDAKSNVPASTVIVSNEAVITDTIMPKLITKPTTKSTTTSTTTMPSTTSTTTTAPITTSTPQPPPSTGKWKVEENNIFCIILQMAAKFNISYTDAKNNNTIYKMNIPSNSSVRGICGATEQIIVLSWETQGSTENNFTIHFTKNETDKHYVLHHLEISLAPEEIPAESNKTVTLVHMAPQYDVALSNSYRCFKEQQLSLALDNTTKTIGYLTVYNLQFQAFRNDNTTVFGLAKDCSFDTPDIVPITVGCALAGLVVIVLIAYLVGRRRSQTRGYLSM